MSEDRDNQKAFSVRVDKLMRQGLSRREAVRQATKEKQACDKR